MKPSVPKIIEFVIGKPPIVKTVSALIETCGLSEAANWDN